MGDTKLVKHAAIKTVTIIINGLLEKNNVERIAEPKNNPNKAVFFSPNFFVNVPTKPPIIAAGKRYANMNKPSKGSIGSVSPNIGPIAIKKESYRAMNAARASTGKITSPTFFQRSNSLRKLIFGLFSSNGRKCFLPRALIINIIKKNKETNKNTVAKIKGL